MGMIKKWTAPLVLSIILFTGCTAKMVGGTIGLVVGAAVGGAIVPHGDVGKVVGGIVGADIGGEAGKSASEQRSSEIIEDSKPKNTADKIES